MSSARILNVRVDATDYATATRTVMSWARESAARYVCHANVHMLMEAHDDEGFADVVNGADLVTPDGMPLVWAMRAKGLRAQQRVYGPTMMLHVLAAAEEGGVPVAFYGSTGKTLTLLSAKLGHKFPRLDVRLLRAPPFAEGQVGSDEDDRALRDCGARVVFVGLGCPKQERWMAARREKLHAVMLGVGAAFDFHAGTVPQAPGVLQEAGLEWAYRLAREPRRLFWRYARHNPRFAALLAKELIKERMSERR